MKTVGLICMCIVAAFAAQSARADGDPASDYLLVQRVFVPYEAATAAKQKRDLTAAVTAANKAGFKIRVAVIESAYDLGSVTAGKYADFVVLDRDILTVGDNVILGTRVIAP